MKKQKEKRGIEANMSFRAILESYPEVAQILLDKGMHCIGCPMAMQETLEQGAKMHNLNVKKLVEELNKKIIKK